jgi:hypothetical protein
MFRTTLYRSAGLTLAGCFLLAGPGRADEGLYRKVASSTALIYRNKGPYELSAGTGFLIDVPGRLVLTARHVVANFNGGVAPAVAVIFANTKDGDIITDAGYYRQSWDRLALPGKVIYENVRRDMAVIQLEKLPAGIKALPLAARPARPGQVIHVVGNSSEHFGGVFNYCHGYVRNVFLWEELGARVVATQAPTNKGDSGGPTVNDAGEVVGFACWSTTGGIMPKESAFHDVQLTGFSVCVSEIHKGLAEMRQRLASARPAGSPAIHGEAHAAVHYLLMNKDVLYCIRVKAKGFVPDLRLDQRLLRPVSRMPAAQGTQWQYLVKPTETREHRLQLGAAPDADVGKGPFTYALTVDQVAFEPAVTLKAPRLELNEQVRKLEAGKVYRIKVRGRGFEPDVQIFDGPRAVMWRYNDGRRANSAGAAGFLATVGLAESEYETSLTFVPPGTRDYRLVIDVSPFSPPSKKARPYTLTIAEEKALLSVAGKLTAQDPLYAQQGPCKVHAVQLTAGKEYEIALTATAFLAQLVVEDAAGKVMGRSFGPAGFHDRMSFRPPRTATYRIVATTRQLGGLGPYVLTVIENHPASASDGGAKGKVSTGSK